MPSKSPPSGTRQKDKGTAVKSQHRNRRSTPIESQDVTIRGTPLEAQDKRKNKTPVNPQDSTTLDKPLESRDAKADAPQKKQDRLDNKSLKAQDVIVVKMPPQNRDIANKGTPKKVARKSQDKKKNGGASAKANRPGTSGTPFKDQVKTGGVNPISSPGLMRSGTPFRDQGRVDFAAHIAYNTPAVWGDPSSTQWENTFGAQQQAHGHHLQEQHATGRNASMQSPSLGSYTNPADQRVFHSHPPGSYTSGYDPSGYTGTTTNFFPGYNFGFGYEQGYPGQLTTDGQHYLPYDFAGNCTNESVVYTRNGIWVDSWGNQYVLVAYEICNDQFKEAGYFAGDCVMPGHLSVHPFYYQLRPWVGGYVAPPHSTQGRQHGRTAIPAQVSGEGSGDHAQRPAREFVPRAQHRASQRQGPQQVHRSTPEAKYYAAKLEEKARAKGAAKSGQKPPSMPAEQAKYKGAENPAPQKITPKPAENVIDASKTMQKYTPMPIDGAAFQTKPSDALRHAQFREAYANKEAEGRTDLRMNIFNESHQRVMDARAILMAHRQAEEDAKGFEDVDDDIFIPNIRY